MRMWDAASGKGSNNVANARLARPRMRQTRAPHLLVLRARCEPAAKFRAAVIKNPTVCFPTSICVCDTLVFFDGFDAKPYRQRNYLALGRSAPGRVSLHARPAGLVRRLFATSGGLHG